MNNWAVAWALIGGPLLRFSKEFYDVALKLHLVLGGEFKKSGEELTLSLPQLPPVPSSVDYDFIRGLLEAGGSFGDDNLFLPLQPSFGEKVEAFLRSEGFSFSRLEEGLLLSGENFNLLLHQLYDSPTEYRSEHFFGRFLSYLTGGGWERSEFLFSLEEGALPPFKKRVSDSGFDLHLIKLLKKEGNLYFFDTGVRVAPPAGFYFDLVPRSSIFKSGFVLANSVGIIDMTYRGTIKVPLVKVDPSKPDPELPWRAVQLIPRRFYPLEPKQVASLNRTERGEGGFGSTG